MYIIKANTASWKPIFISTDCMTILCQALWSSPCLLKVLLYDLPHWHSRARRWLRSCWMAIRY